MAHAGQLFTDYYGLVTALQNSGPIILGTVVAVDTAKGSLTLLVKKYWTKPVSSFTSKTNHTLEVGQSLNLTINQGIEWTDPNESPIDQRLYGHLNFKTVKKGEDVILAGDELLAPTPTILDRLTRISSAQFKTDYPEKMTESVLISDLEDFDLSPKAFKELLRRKKADLKTLMTMKDAELASRLISSLIEFSAQDSNINVFSQAKIEILQKHDVLLKTQLLRKLFNHTQAKPEKYEDFASLLVTIFTKYDPQLEATENYPIRQSTFDLSRELLGRLGPNSHIIQKTDSAFFNLFWIVQLHRFKQSSTYDVSDAFRDFIKGQPLPTSLKLISVGFKTFNQSALENANLLDTTNKALLAALQKLVNENPDKSLAAPLSQLPVLEFKTMDDQSHVLEQMIKMAVVLAKKDPSVVSVLKPNIEKYLASDFETFSTVKSDKGTEIQMGVSMKLGGSLNFVEFDDYVKIYRK